MFQRENGPELSVNFRTVTDTALLIMSQVIIDNEKDFIVVYPSGAVKVHLRNVSRVLCCMRRLVDNPDAADNFIELLQVHSRTDFRCTGRVFTKQRLSTASWERAVSLIKCGLLNMLRSAWLRSAYHNNTGCKGVRERVFHAFCKLQLGKEDSIGPVNRKVSLIVSLSCSFNHLVQLL